MIKHVAFTAYPVRDMKRARAFYEGDLGLPAPTEIAGGKWVEYYLGDTCFALTSIGGDKFIPRNDGAGIAFEVDDVDAMFARIQQRKLPVKLPPTDSPICRMTMIEDTEGNYLVLHKKKTA